MTRTTDTARTGEPISSNKRNLTKSQKMLLLQKVEEQVAKEARERQSAMLKQNTVGSNLTQRKDDETGRTAEIMAKKFGFLSTYAADTGSSCTV